jgi:hypothetical protein
MSGHVDASVADAVDIDGQDVVVSPYVSWVHLALAYDPVATPTEGRLKTLRNHHVCPAGVKVPVRTVTGVSGSRYWYSSLGLWSAILFRSGQRDVAVEVTERANELSKLLGRVDWQHVSSARPGSDLIHLAKETDSIARSSTTSLQLSRTTGTWTWVRDGKAVIETSDGKEITIPENSPYLAQSRLGDPLVVVHQEAPNGTDIRLVLPGCRVAGAPQSEHWDEDAALAPDEGGLHGDIPDTPANREFFERLAKTTPAR